MESKKMVKTILIKYEDGSIKGYNRAALLERFKILFGGD